MRDELDVSFGAQDFFGLENSMVHGSSLTSRPIGILPPDSDYHWELGGGMIAPTSTLTQPDFLESQTTILRRLQPRSLVYTMTARRVRIHVTLTNTKLSALQHTEGYHSFNFIGLLQLGGKTQGFAPDSDTFTQVRFDKNAHSPSHRSSNSAFFSLVRSGMSVTVSPGTHQCN